MNIPPSVQKRVHYWLTGPFDDKTKNAVKALEKTPQKLIEAFQSDLSFGTGGMRSLMGVGTSFLNIYTIRLATQGLANYLKKQKSPNPSVVIGFDSRHHSEEFAKEAACVLAGNGIAVHFIPELRPTPYISFTCRYKRASAAIMITASHNPKEYNGYKVYWADGAQVVHPHDQGIVDEVEQLKDLSSVHLSPFTHSLIQPLSLTELDQAYLQAIAPLPHFPKENQQYGNSLHIIYTSLHGTGITIIPKALLSWGFSNVHPVKKQVIVDGNFPTVSFPNPEYPETMRLCVEALQEQNGDIALASDPDADRLGVAILHQGKPYLFSGNEMAALCTDFLCKHLNTPAPHTVVTTIVTTELLKAICQAFRVELMEVLTGFKYIGEKIHQFEQQGQLPRFLFGAEESYGSLLGTHARDKDAIIASCLIAEMALFAKREGKTLLDRLHRLYQERGIFREAQASCSFKVGKEGMDEMEALMNRLRTSFPKEINGKAVLYIEDYQQSKRFYPGKTATESLTLPQSDVLLFRLSDQSKLVIRPSGTEPKLKIYGSVSSSHFSSIEDGIKACDENLNTLLVSFKQCIGLR